MPRALAARVIACLVIGAGAIYAWQQMFPSEEVRIRRQLEALADAANEVTADLSGMASAARVAMHFTEDVVLDPGRGIAPLRGRETIMAVAGRVRPRAGATHVDIQNADVAIAPDGSTAAVTVAVTLTRDTGADRETLDAREFALTMVKRDSVWLISQVTLIDTLR